jgi:ABC-2 type transport system permease protein
MKKFVAVVKHEYRKIVLKWTFLLGTLLFPVIGACFALVPAVIFSIKGEPTRIVIVDPANKIGMRIRENLAPEKIAARMDEAMKEAVKDIPAAQPGQMNQTPMQGEVSFVFIDYNSSGRSPDEIRQDLNEMAAANKIDAYLIAPPSIDGNDARFEFRSRKAGDFVAGNILREVINDAVRSQRLADANINEKSVMELSRRVTIDSKSLDDKGREKDSDMLLAASFVIGLMIYITLAIYGQVIMGAVVEEKETRIAEILFSSAKPYELMLGKLVGVGLAGLTQLAIWVISIAGLIGFLAVQSDMSGLFGGMPHITPLMVGYFLLYFLLGYFAYASIFALIGSVVTTVQEGGQFAFPPVMLMLIGFYFSFAVIRDPNSSLSFWISISPFFAPMTMPVRILAEMPPVWQIALSVGVNVFTIMALVWLASRVYRVGMLMYGKRATLPEIWKWIRQV